MTVSARTRKAIEESIITDISNNRPDLDLVSGPLSDVVVTPQTNLIKVVEDKIERASLLTSLKFYQNFTSTELDDFASTYGITRLQGTKSKTILAFVMNSQPAVDISIPKGTSVQIPKAVLANNQYYQFMTSESILYRAFDANRFSTTVGSNRKWIFYAPAECINVGNYSNGIQPKRLTEVSTTTTAFTQVYNITTTKGGTDIEDDEHFAKRIFSIMGYGSVLHPAGIKKYVFDEFKNDILDISVQKGKKVLRVPDTKQAIDIYVIGNRQKNHEEIFTYDGSRKFVFQKQPLVEITLNTSANQTFENNVDFYLSKDYPTEFNPGINNFTQEGAVAGSVKSTDSLVWNFTTASNLPTIGDSVTSYYIYNKLISDIQEINLL